MGDAAASIFEDVFKFSLDTVPDLYKSCGLPPNKRCHTPTECAEFLRKIRNSMGATNLKLYDRLGVDIRPASQSDSTVSKCDFSADNVGSIDLEAEWGYKHGKWVIKS